MTVEITAQPFPFALDLEHVALIVIDMQRDFIEPGGFGDSLGNDVSRLEAIVPTTRRLIDGFRKAGLPVIHTRECHKPDLSDCPPAKRLRGEPALRIGDEGPMGRVLIAGSPGAEIVPPLATLLERLEVAQLVFAGVTTEVCVQTTMREANDRGFECLLATDATESYFAEFKEAAIRMIIAQGAIVGWVAETDAIVSALQKEAAHA